MSETVVVRYETRADAAAENQRLVERVFRELNETAPEGLRYAAFRLADGVGFVHVALIEGHDNPLRRSAAFAEFQHGAAGRMAVPPVSAGATLVGSYRLFRS
ncbi:hypothetical protein [Microbispora sp. KK1-11]|uniref:hypothetical protein n=1 Tax=Microbispora sp. KK1-11 TaxID=2053005 RepID=UPI00115BD3B7|nr:hypothetical protein [Microbispora sp. KK1-11]TQS21598.1 hypothetical protein FLW16_39200 [Microbispora sp. KK1-11]